MPSIIDLPAELQRAITLSWTMDNNHGVAESGFSGHVQVQRGSLERWMFTMGVRAMNRRDAQIAQGFFLQLEGPLNLFRMHDPAASKPLGHGAGLPVVRIATAAGARTVETEGWKPGTALMPGDWVQIGNQLCKARAIAFAGADGRATLDVWPKIMHDLPAQARILTRPARGLFRMLSDVPAWDLDAGRLLRPYEFKLSGVQVVLRGDEAPIALGWN